MNSNTNPLDLAAEKRATSTRRPDASESYVLQVARHPNLTHSKYLSRARVSERSQDSDRSTTSTLKHPIVQGPLVLVPRSTLFREYPPPPRVSASPRPLCLGVRAP